MDAIQKREPLFTNRALVGLTVPIILDSLLTIVAGMVDSAMVSSAGEAAVSAVSLVDSLNLLFVTIFAAISIGGSVVTAQYVGSRNYKGAGTSANQLFYAATAAAAVMAAVMLPLREPVLRWIYGGIEADVFENASIYSFYTLLGFPFFAMGAASGAVLRAMGKNRQSVAITIAYNVLNVIGNAALIYGLKMGVAGAAISTSVSRVAYAVVGLYLAHSKKLPARFSALLRLRLDWPVMRRVLRLGLTQGLENGMFHIGKILIASLVSSFGTVAIAANSVSGTVNNIGWNIISAFGTVLLTVVGQCVGAGEPEQAKGYMKKMLSAATVTSVLLFGSIFLFSDTLVRLFDFGPETLEICSYYTAASALFSILACYSFSFAPVSAFRAAGDIRYAVTLSVTSMFAFRVALCYVLNALMPSLGLMCVYLGMFVDWTFRSVMNIIRFRSGKWLHQKLV